MNEATQLILFLVIFFVIVVILPIGGIIWSIRRQKKLATELSDTEEVKRIISEAESQGEEGISKLTNLLAGLTTALARAQMAQNRKSVKTSTIRVLEALTDLGHSHDNGSPKLQKWVSETSGFNTISIIINNILFSDNYKDFDKEEFNIDINIARLLTTLSYQFGKTSWATSFSQQGVYQKLFSPLQRQPANLRYMIVADQIISDTEQAKGAISLLVDNIANERGRWIKESTGLVADFLIAGLFGNLLGAVISTVGKNVALETSSRQTAQSLLLLTTENIHLQTFQKMSDQACFIVALHACGTGLAKIATQYPTLVKAEFLKRSQPHEQDEKAVLAFALAVNGDLSVIEALRKLTVSNDWYVKIMAFEGLIALANNEKTSNDVKISEQISALTDRDLRVSTYIAQVMTNTQNPLYQPQLIKLAESSESSLRVMSLHTLFFQAMNGDEIANTKLKSMAEQDKDKNVREQAGKYVFQLSGESISSSPQNTSDHITLEHEKKKSSNQTVKIIASIAFGILGCILGCWGILSLNAPPDPSMDSETLRTGAIFLCFMPAFFLLLISIGLGIWAARSRQVSK